MKHIKTQEEIDEIREREQERQRFLERMLYAHSMDQEFVPRNRRLPTTIPPLPYCWRCGGQKQWTCGCHCDKFGCGVPGRVELRKHLPW